MFAHRDIWSDRLWLWTDEPDNGPDWECLSHGHFPWTSRLYSMDVFEQPHQSVDRFHWLCNWMMMLLLIDVQLTIETQSRIIWSTDLCKPIDVGGSETIEPSRGVEWVEASFGLIFVAEWHICCCTASASKMIRGEIRCHWTPDQDKESEAFIQWSNWEWPVVVSPGECGANRRAIPLATEDSERQLIRTLVGMLIDLFIFKVKECLFSSSSLRNWRRRVRCSPSLSLQCRRSVRDRESSW